MIRGNEVKTCLKCKETLDVVLFGKDENSTDGLKYCCKSCWNKINRLYYEKDPERYKEHHRKSYLKNLGKRLDYQKKYYKSKKAKCS